MKSKTTVTIANQNFTLISEDSAEYVHKIASYVDKKIREIEKDSHTSFLNSAVLACVNIADEYYKSLDATENMRQQVKEYIEDSTKTKMELQEARREIARLRGTKNY